ncbi:hypothetical protein CPC16_004014 [Podila verticillata]|nr:hypothetical protein CPC16_004014 [Podila verticillata]
MSNESGNHALAQALDQALAKGKPSVASEIGPLTTQSPSGTLSYPPTQPPPSFDSFPDIALSSLSLATAPPIPSFSSFPDITPPSTSTPEISPKDDSSKSKKKHKKDSKEKSKRNRSISSERQADRKKRSSSRRDRSKDRDRDRDQDRSRHDDRSRTEGSRSSRRESSSDYHNRSNHSSSRHEPESSRSRDKDTDRERERVKEREREKEKDRERDRARERDRDRDRRQDRGKDRSRGGHSRSPERKKSRKDDDDSWIERRAQEKQEGQRQPSSFARAADKKHKPGEWILDVRGDPNMLRYGLSQYETPSYVRHGGGRVLGCPPHWRIDYAQTKANGGLIVMREGRMSSKVKRYTDPNATWKDRSQEYRRITRAKAEELAKTLGLDQEDPAYISLDIRKAPTKDRDSDSESESDSGMVMSGKSVDYRDIHGKSVYKDQDDDLMQTTSDQEEEGAESALDALQRRRTLLDAELRKEPKDSRKWLEFISIADDIDLVTSRRSVVGVSAHSAGHAEVKLSYFDRALLHNPTDERLLLEYMNCYRQAYSSPKVLAKWDELLQSSQIRSAWPGLWIEYLDYRQRHQLSFSVNNFVSVAQEALESLSSVARMLWNDNRRNKADLEVRNRLVRFESVMVHVIVRVCALLKQAGYIERAQAILQGEMEFLFSIPADLVDEPFDTRLGELEDYWDKEQPRFGEKDAKGWTHYFTAKEVADVEYLLDTATLPVKDDPMDDLFRPFVEADKDRFEFGRWARMEKEVNAACWFPIRTSEVDTMPAQLEDDPYGIIMFDDIQPFIADLHTMEARMQFVDCMFHFQGLPVSLIAGSNGLSHQRRSTSTEQVKPRGVGSYNPYFHDSLLLNVGLDSTYSTEENNPGLGRVFPPILTAARAEEIVRKEIELSIKDCELEEENWSCVWNLPLKVFTQGTDAIFGKHVGSEKKNHRYPWASVSSHDEVQQFNKEFVRNSLKQLIEVVPMEKTYRRGLMLYHMMMETFDTMATTKELTQSYSKVDSSLELMNGQAQSEKTLGRIKEARKAYRKILSISQSLPDDHQIRLPLVHRFYAELEWEQGRPGVALEILVLLAEGSQANISNIPDAKDKNDVPYPSPTRLVKARQFYSQKVAQLHLARPTPTSNDYLGSQWFEPALDLIVCYAWFEYLSMPKAAGSEVEAGITVFENAVQELDRRNPDTEVESGELQDQSVLNESVNMRSILLPAHLNPTSGPAASKESKKGPKRKICTATEAEMLWIQLAKMVYFHSIRAGESLREGQSFGAGFQPRALRRIVHSGLERFPNCSILQSLYFWTEAKQRVHGRVRTWVNDQVTQTLSGAPSRTGYPPADKNVLWMFGLYYELWHQDTYNVHTIRTMLESALESSSKATSFSSSPNLWLIYLELEIRESIRQKSFRDLGQDTKRSSSSSTSKDIDAEFGTRIKGLLHRALADCPWYKDLYLFAFEPRVRSLFSLEELEALYETMLAKEIRVRQELPERVSREIDMDPEGDVVMTGA